MGWRQTQRSRSSVFMVVGLYLYTCRLKDVAITVAHLLGNYAKHCIFIWRKQIIPVCCYWSSLKSNSLFFIKSTGQLLMARATENIVKSDNECFPSLWGKVKFWLFFIANGLERVKYNLTELQDFWQAVGKTGQRYLSFHNIWWFINKVWLYAYNCWNNEYEMLLTHYKFLCLLQNYFLLRREHLKKKKHEKYHKNVMKKTQMAFIQKLEHW